MPRPAKGAVRWNERTNVWEVRVSLRDGTRSRPIAMTGLAGCAETPACTSEARTSGAACPACLFAEESGQRVSKKMRDGCAVDVATEETVVEWFGRYFEWRENRGKGSEDVKGSRQTFGKWVTRNEETTLATTSMRRVSSRLLEEFVTFLDRTVRAGAIASSTAVNIWTDIATGFAVATIGYKTKYKCKDRSLRILTTNPAATVDGPDDDATEKLKPFLRPDEILLLLGCADVPLERRHVYAVAIYTACRQGELRALRVRDVDFEAMQITITKQLKDGVEKHRTKGGRARIIAIEPNLLPLLRILVEGRDGNERLLSVGARNRCALHLREDLLTAGCTREALHVPDDHPTHEHIKFHNLKDTCGVHMSVRRDPPQDIQWRLAHTDLKTSEIYIAGARNEAGPNFGTPLGPLPDAVLRPPPSSPTEGAGEPIGAEPEGPRIVSGVLDPVLDIGRKRPQKPRENSGGAGNRSRRICVTKRRERARNVAKGRGTPRRFATKRDARMRKGRTRERPCSRFSPSISPTWRLRATSRQQASPPTRSADCSPCKRRRRP